MATPSHTPLTPSRARRSDLWYVVGRTLWQLMVYGLVIAALVHGDWSRATFWAVFGIWMSIDANAKEIQEVLLKRSTGRLL